MSPARAARATDEMHAAASAAALNEDLALLLQDLADPTFSEQSASAEQHYVLSSNKKLSLALSSLSSAAVEKQ